MLKLTIEKSITLIDITIEIQGLGKFLKNLGNRSAKSPEKMAAKKRKLLEDH